MVGIRYFDAMNVRMIRDAEVRKTGSSAGARSILGALPVLGLGDA